MAGDGVEVGVPGRSDGVSADADGGAGRASRVRARVRGMPNGTFGPASEEPYRRRDSDWVRLGDGDRRGAFLVAYHDDRPARTRPVPVLQRAAGRPAAASSRRSTGPGRSGSVLDRAAAALIARRWRLARDLFLAGFLAWSCRAAPGRAGRQRVAVRCLRRRDPPRPRSPSFPLVRLAVVVAVVSGGVAVRDAPDAAARSVARGRARRLGDVPRHRVSRATSSAACSSGGGSPRPCTSCSVRRAVDRRRPGRRVARRARRRRRRRASRPGAADGELAVPGHDAPGPLGCASSAATRPTPVPRQALALPDVQGLGPQLYLTREQDVEHEAYTLLLAQRAGVHVPEVVVAGTAGPGAALIVERGLDGRLLAELDAGRRQRRAPHRSLASGGCAARGARRARRAATRHIRIVDDGRPVICDFLATMTGAQERRRTADLAELLSRPRRSWATSAPSPHSAAGARDRRARRGHPDAAAAGADAAPPSGCSGSTRTRANGSTRCATPSPRGAGVDLPELVELHRVSSDEPDDGDRHVDRRRGAAGPGRQPPGALGHGQERELVAGRPRADPVARRRTSRTRIALMGCVPIRLPLWPTTETQVAMSFGNLAIPAIGGIAIQIRFLQKRGLDLAVRRRRRRAAEHRRAMSCARSCCSSSRSRSRRTRSTSGRSTPRRRSRWC